ncbi:MAG: hypothetical protein WC284_12735 [Candidimonas sp.]
MSDTDNVQVPENDDNQPELKIVDIQNALRIIDVAAQRGAFHGPELSGVGAVRDRLDKFLAAANPQAADDTTDTVSEEDKEEVTKSSRRKKK